jgi:hypothetical protein
LNALALAFGIWHWQAHLKPQVSTIKSHNSLAVIKSIPCGLQLSPGLTSIKIM